VLPDNAGQLKDSAHVGMRDMLFSVAERGYAPFYGLTDPRVALGSVRNVWDVVGRSTFAPSVPPEAWDDDPGCSTIVVAASQAMRLLLARELTRSYEVLLAASITLQEYQSQ